ncbi:MAG: N-acetylmuramoyl-L-alanine amidase, partial [Clostridia bacterium]|nr:N-acetylmuramoyl-L-alanine amidase [Clostridia bacterium]
KIILEFKNNPSSLTGTVIMLDPGHGGYGSPGTNYRMEVYEETVTYSIAMKAAEILRAEGATVIVTRSENDALSLAQRVKIARNENPDMFVSIHCDGADDTSWMGTHTFYYKNYSMPLAQSIHNQLVNAWRNYYYTDTQSKAYSTLDRKIKFFPFNVTRIEECPSVLVECGYLTNELDGQFLISEGGQKILATAIAQGIIDYIANY